MDEILTKAEQSVGFLVEDMRAAFPLSKPGAEEIVIEQLLKAAVEIRQTLHRLQQGR